MWEPCAFVLVMSFWVLKFADIESKNAWNCARNCVFFDCAATADC